MTRIHRALSRLHDVLGRLLAVMEAAEAAVREGDRISIRWAAPTPPPVPRCPRCRAVTWATHRSAAPAICQACYARRGQA